MNSIFRTLLTIGALFSALAGCTEDAMGPKKTLLPLEGDIIFQIYEGYGAANDRRPRGDVIANPRIALRLKTVKEYGCSNYDIEYRKTVSGNRVLIQLLGRSIGPICLTSIGPATSSLFLDLEAGSYELTFSYGSKTSSFLASVTDSALSIAPGEEGFARCEYELYWRHPPRSLAFYCGTTVEASWMCEEFVNRLSSSVQIQEFSFPQVGQPPWGIRSEGAYYNAPARFFLYTDEADFQAAGAVVEDFAKQVIGSQQGIVLSLLSWRNDRFLSWLYLEP